MPLLMYEIVPTFMGRWCFTYI